MTPKFKKDQIVYENEKYFQEGKSQFGSSLKRIRGVKIQETIKINSPENPYWAYVLQNDLIVNESFLSDKPHNFINN